MAGNSDGRCLSCQADLRPGVRFCTSCGSPVSHRPGETNEGRRVPGRVVDGTDSQSIPPSPPVDVRQQVQRSPEAGEGHSWRPRRVAFWVGGTLIASIVAITVVATIVSRGSHRSRPAAARSTLLPTPRPIPTPTKVYNPSQAATFLDRSGTVCPSRGFCGTSRHTLHARETYISFRAPLTAWSLAWRDNCTGYDGASQAMIVNMVPRHPSSWYGSAGPPWVRRFQASGGRLSGFAIASDRAGHIQASGVHTAKLYPVRYRGSRLILEVMSRCPWHIVAARGVQRFIPSSPRSGGLSSSQIKPPPTSTRHGLTWVTGGPAPLIIRPPQHQYVFHDINNPGSWMSPGFRVKGPWFVYWGLFCSGRPLSVLVTGRGAGDGTRFHVVPRVWSIGEFHEGRGGTYRIAMSTKCNFGILQVVGRR